MLPLSLCKTMEVLLGNYLRCLYLEYLQYNEYIREHFVKRSIKIYFYTYTLNVVLIIELLWF